MLTDLPDLSSILLNFLSRCTRLSQHSHSRVLTCTELKNLDVVELVTLFSQNRYRCVKTIPCDSELTLHTRADVDVLLLIDFSLDHVGCDLKSICFVLLTRSKKSTN